MHPIPPGAAGLIEVELGYGLGIGRVERGRLVEVVGGPGVVDADGDPVWHYKPDLLSRVEPDTPVRFIDETGR